MRIKHGAIMVLKVVKIVGFMLARIVGYALAALRGKGKTYVQGAYLRWARYVLSTFDVQCTVRGGENWPANAGKISDGGRPVVILANHQSQLDIPSLVHGLNRLMGFVAKRELGRIPVLAYWMRQTGCVFIDRSNKSEAQRTLNETAKTLGEYPIVVFPEGTRSKTGALLPFKPGGARLALLAKALILPARIEGTREACEARAGRSGPFQVTVTFHAPLDTAELPPDRAGAEKVKAYVEACWRGEDAMAALHAAGAGVADR
jgi:1-acyl-sn-glycerol-3-phosphate acyltransferase